MSNPQIIFHSNMKDVEGILSLYAHLEATIQIPNLSFFDDLLRASIVYAMSAFDKLIHDVVCLGMVEIFKEKRPQTDKYKTESIPITLLQQLQNPLREEPAELLFQRTIHAKLQKVSFQDPEKVADGLSYVWNEPHKWRCIASAMQQEEKEIKKRLKLIVNRRNSIVHEADMDPSTNSKYSIFHPECKEVVEFLLRLGDAICKIVLHGSQTI